MHWFGCMFKTHSVNYPNLWWLPADFFLVPFPIFILLKCRGSLFRLLQRSGTKLDVRRRIHMALDIVSAFSLYEPIIHLIQWIDYGHLVCAFIFERGACQSPSKQNLCVPSSTLVICIWCLYRQGAWIIFIIPGHLSYIEIWNHLIFWLIRTGLWRYNPLYLFSTFFLFSCLPPLNSSDSNQVADFGISRLKRETFLTTKTGKGTVSSSNLNLNTWYIS